MYLSAAARRILQGFECPLQNRLALERYKRSLPDKSADELRREALELAELALVAQPAAIQWLLQQVMEGNRRQPPPIEGWHTAMAEELSLQEGDG